MNDERIEGRLTAESQNRRDRKTDRKSSQFIRGPIPLRWIEQACHLPGKVGCVILGIWYMRGIFGEPVALSPALLASFGVTPKTGRRVLQRLEAAGLVSVERRSGRSPRVTVIPVRSGEGGTDAE